MKKLGIVLLLVAGLTSPALAGPIGDTGSFNITRLGGLYAGQGGEFTLYGYSGLTNADYVPAVTKNLGPSVPSFQTFCVEHSEYIASPSYFVVNSVAVLGGAGGPSPDPLSKGTAWLYSQFARGSLIVPGGWDYFSGAAPTRNIEAGRLQEAIWALEGELLVAPAPGANKYYDAALLNGGAADAPAGYLGVYVLNAFSSAKYRELYVANPGDSTLWAAGIKQDQLYYRVPDGGATLMMLGAALVGLGALRRRFRR